MIYTCPSHKDRIDGRLLAHYGYQRQPKLPLPEAIKQLDSLLQRQEDIKGLLNENPASGGIRAKGSPLRHFYQRLVGRDNSKKLALVASSRKIVVWSWAVFRQGVDFDPSPFATISS